MTLNNTIIAARKRKGLTQEALADATQLTIRTIQRIESGESIPRSHTLKAIAGALDIPFETLTDTGKEKENDAATTSTHPAPDQTNDTIHFLQVLNLSSFTYLVIPYVHFLVPMQLLKKRKEKGIVVTQLARDIIKTQIYWVIATHLVFFGALAYNFWRAAYFNKSHLVSYLLPFFIMYFLNAIIILTTNIRLKRSVLAFAGRHN
jgi:transcriptional regulator with XRE-family HTH domain